MGLWDRRAGRLTAENVGFRPGQCGGWTPPVIELGDPTGGGWDFVHLPPRDRDPQDLFSFKFISGVLPEKARLDTAGYGELPK
jgi:hypothetical protein